MNYTFVNPEKLLDRYETLLGAIRDFPDSELSPIWEKELADIETAFEHGLI